MNREFFVGLLFLIAMFLVGYVTIMIRGVGSSTEAYAMRVQFDEVSGLREGDQVRIHGFHVGEVRFLDYDIERQTIDVDLVLREKIQPRAGYHFMVRSSSALGGTFVDFEPGTGTPIQETDLQGTSRDLFDEIEQLVAENRESIRVGLERFADLMQQATEGEGLLRTLLTDQQVSSDFRQAIEDLRSVTADISEGMSNDRSIMGRLLRDEALADSAKATFENAQLITDDLRVVVRDIREGKGALGRLISDEETGENLTQMLGHIDEAAVNLNGLLGEVRDGKGILAKIINDEEWAEMFFNTLSSVEGIAQKINSGDGTFAKLLNDPQLFNDAVQLVSLLSESVEDQREQAPINSFINVLFSAF